MQFGLVRALARPETCVFMVGDAKQSIYRFRNADPTIFMDMAEKKIFGEGEEALPVRVICLRQNFRSLPVVLGAANDVFDSAMRRNVTEMDYTEDQRLVNSRDAIPGVKNELILLNMPSSGKEALVQEALQVARRIHQLVGTPADPAHPEKVYQYRDMAILLSKVSGIGETLANLLTEQGIPVYFDGKTSYTDTPEISRMLSLLRVIHNTYRDSDLIAVLKLPCFGLLDTDLAQLRLIDNRP